MDAFTLTDYLLSAILGVLMFMIIIKASDRFFPVILVCFLFPLVNLKAADEQDIVDAVVAANSAITGAVNTVGSTNSNTNFAVWAIQSGISSLNTEVSDQGSTLDNIYTYTVSNNSSLSSISSNSTSAYYFLSSIASNTGTALTSLTGLQDTLDDIDITTQSIDSSNLTTANNTGVANTKLDTLDDSMQAVKAAIEACCYEEMQKLIALDENTDEIEALLETIDESIGDFQAQEYLANANRDELLGDIIVELEAMNLDVSGIHDDTTQLVTLTQEANSTLASLLTGIENIDTSTSTSGGSLTFDPIEGDGLVVDDPQNFDDDFKDTLDIDFASDITEVSSPVGDDVDMLKTSFGIETVIGDLDGLTIPDDSASMSPLLAVGTLDWSHDANLGDFDFVDAADAYWTAIQPIVLLLVTGFIAYRMLCFTMIHTQKAMAA